MNARGLMLVAMTCAVYGCFVSSTEGKNGRLDFHIGSDRPDCSLGCSIDRPFMIGTTTTLFVEPGAESLRGDSSNTDILVVEVSNQPIILNGEQTVTSIVDVTAVAAGSADIEIFEGPDRLDSLLVETKEAMSMIISLEDEDDELSQIELILGTQGRDLPHVFGRTFDKLGQELFAGSGWNFRSSDETVFLVNDKLDGPSEPLLPQSAGEAMLTVSIGEFRAEAQVTVQ